MTFHGFPDEAFTFFADLARDNTKEFWHAHKDTYEKAVREPAEELLAELEDEFGPGKLFRPRRDTRFTKDKSPYKTYQGVTIGAGGTTGYYLQVEADGLFFGAGFHAFDSATTKRYREAVADDDTGPELAKLVDRLTGKGFELVGDRVKTHPRGYPADHPRIELLRYASLGAERRVPRDALQGRKALTTVRNGFRELRPLVERLGRHLEG